MQSYLIFSCHGTPFLLKKVKMLFINWLEKLKIEDGEDQYRINTFIEPPLRGVVEIVSHVNRYRGHGEEEVIDRPIRIEIERNKGKHKHAKK